MFDWDKANINHIAAHGITPAEAEQVILNNPADLEFQLRNGEDRIAQVRGNRLWPYFGCHHDHAR